MSKLLLLLLSVLLPAFLAPFTKVEESFTIQAVYDLIFRGRDLDSYDHKQFPGPVPRSWVHALLLANPFVRLGRAFAVFSLDPVYLQVLIRCWNGTLSICSFLFLDSCIDINGNAFILLLVSQFHLMFYASRTLGNVASMQLITIALGCFITKYHKVMLSILIFVSVVFRFETAILYLIPIALFRVGLCSCLKMAPLLLFVFVSSLALTVVVDSYYWQKTIHSSEIMSSKQWNAELYGVKSDVPSINNYWIWPELSVFLFNGAENRSENWGAMSFHWYLSNALPKAIEARFLLFFYVAFVSVWKAWRGRRKIMSTTREELNDQEDDGVHNSGDGRSNAQVTDGPKEIRSDDKMHDESNAREQVSSQATRSSNLMSEDEDDELLLFVDPNFRMMCRVVLYWVVIPVFILSFVSHKEIRFIFPSILALITAIAMSQKDVGRWGIKTPNLLWHFVLGLSVAMYGARMLASIYNYPAGWALFDFTPAEKMQKMDNDYKMGFSAPVKIIKRHDAYEDEDHTFFSKEYYPPFARETWTPEERGKLGMERFPDEKIIRIDELILPFIRSFWVEFARPLIYKQQHGRIDKVMRQYNDDKIKNVYLDGYATMNGITQFLTRAAGIENVTKEVYDENSRYDLIICEATIENLEKFRNDNYRLAGVYYGFEGFVLREIAMRLTPKICVFMQKLSPKKRNIEKKEGVVG